MESLIAGKGSACDDDRVIFGRASRFRGGARAELRSVSNPLDLAIELGDLGAAKEKLRGLRVERERVAGEVARARTKLPTMAELPRLREKLREIEATLKADEATQRRFSEC